MLRRPVAAFCVLGGYAGAAVLLTWPLAATTTTRLPATVGTCYFDTLLVGWILAHLSHALVAAPSTLVHGNIYHPAPYALFYGPTALGALPLFAPVFWATGNATAALNVTLLGGVTLSAWSIHLVLAGRISPLAAMVGAATFLSTRWLFWEFVPTAPFYACLPLLPVIVVRVAEARERPPSWSLLPLVALQCAVDVAYVAAAVLIPLGCIAVGRIARPASRRAGLRLLGIVAATPLVLSPLYAGYALVAARNPDLATQTNWRGLGTPLYPWLGEPLTEMPWGPISRLAPAAIAPVAFVLIGIGLASVVSRSASGAPIAHGALWRHALLWTVLGLGMSLTPSIEWGGRVMPLPQHLIAALPVPHLIREPTRLGIAALVGLSLLAGLAFEECAARLPRAMPGRAAVVRVLALVVIVALYAQYARGFAWPFPRRALPARYPTFLAEVSSPIDDVLRGDSGPLLELPVGPGGVYPLFHAGPMYRSIRHWRPLVNGYDGYWPAGFPERMALAGRLPDATALARLREESGLDTILVHLRFETAPTRAAWLALADAGGNGDLELLARADEDLLFRVRRTRE